MNAENFFFLDRSMQYNKLNKNKNSLYLQKTEQMRHDLNGD